MKTLSSVEDAVVEDFFNILTEVKDFPPEVKDIIIEEKKMTEKQISVIGEARFIPVALLAGAKIIPWIISISKLITASVATAVEKPVEVAMGGILSWTGKKFAKWIKRKFFDLEKKVDQRFGLEDKNIVEVGEVIRETLKQKPDILKNFNRNVSDPFLPLLAKKGEAKLGTYAFKLVGAINKIIGKGKPSKEKRNGIKEKLADIENEYHSGKISKEEFRKLKLYANWQLKEMEIKLS